MANRRQFLTVVGAAAVATAGLSLPAEADAAARTGGHDLTGWTTVLGDGVYAAPGQAPVTADDIAIRNNGRDSLLRANIHNRGIMAHVLSYQRATSAAMMTTAHRGRFSFRLPFLPSTAGGPLNAQTVEGGLFVWDGAGTQLDYGTAFQWILNPWLDNFGQIMAWSSANDGSWVAAGFLQPDTEWHTVLFGVDPVHRRARLVLDGRRLPVTYSSTPKSGFGTDVSVRLQAEAVSIYPGVTATSAPQHEVLVKNWSWAHK
jgi:hypothetical protein